MIDNAAQRTRMVRDQLQSRGIQDPRILEALRTVPREAFIPGQLAEFAYDDTPLPIEAGQTISQPYVVALMLEALELTPGSRLLEVGAGSGYAAAVASRIAARVFAIERHQELTDLASERCQRLGYTNVQILCGDGSQGWPEFAPFDAILASAAAPDVPRALREQLAIGGRLVLPVGDGPRTQELVRVVRIDEHEFEQVSLGPVQFVPMIGAQAWAAAPTHTRPNARMTPEPDSLGEGTEIVRGLRHHATPFAHVHSARLDELLERIGDARIVLLGESTHGTHEFYEMRARITRALIEQKGFQVVALEADWPDTATLDRYARQRPSTVLRTPAFSDFPTWMWRNHEMRSFVDWLAHHNTPRSEDEKVSLHGLDLYSLNNSIGAVLDYLDEADPDAAQIARERYACFSPWETDPAVYGRAASAGRLETCEPEAVAMLNALLERRLAHTDDPFFDAERNAHVIRNAERYYRAMYRSSRDSWNLRDTHMFDTLRSILEHRGPQARAVIWAHNSHLGNAAATEMGARGELNLGQLVRETWGVNAYAIGFGTHSGRVAAASNWGDPVQEMTIRPSHPDSYERLFHRTGMPGFMIGLRSLHGTELHSALTHPRLQRAIGVIYRPQSELASHYFQASLPVQFDEFIWCDDTQPVRPLDLTVGQGADTFPFAL